MKEQIKKSYLILGITLLILVIISLTIWISKQINWTFFTFDKEGCIVNYLIEREMGPYIEGNVSDERLKEIAQIWNLDLNELLALIENEKQELEQEIEKAEKEYQECKARVGKYKGYRGGCVAPLRGAFFSLSKVLSAQIEKGNFPKLSEQFIEKLTSEGVCPRPSFLK